MAGEESAVELLKDPEKVQHALVPLEMRENGNPRSIWEIPEDLGLHPVVIPEEATPNREILQQYDGGVEK